MQEQERSRRNSGIDVRAVGGAEPTFASTLRITRRRRSSRGAGEKEGEKEAEGECANDGEEGGKAPPAGPKDLPVELWELILGFLAMDIDDDSYQPVGDLFSCALTCQVCCPSPALGERLWALLAHGVGVVTGSCANSFSTSGYIGMGLSHAAAAV